MIYPFHCDGCGKYKEIWASVEDRPKKPKCDCGVRMHRVFSVPEVNMHEAYDWSNENGGKGRKIESLKRKHWDEGDHLYKKSRKDLIETYKRMELRHDVC